MGYRDSLEMGSHFAQSPAVGMGEAPQYAPSSSLAPTRTQPCIHSNQSPPANHRHASSGTRSESGLKSCNHYLLLLQNLTTLENALHQLRSRPIQTPLVETTYQTSSSSTIACSHPFHSSPNVSKEALKHCTDALECKYCLCSSSSILVLTVSLQKVAELFQASMGIHGILI